MKIKDKNGRFAKSTSNLYKFCKRTGKSPEEYYEWARKCGLKGSFAHKDKQVMGATGIRKIEDLRKVEQLDIQVFEGDYLDAAEALCAFAKNPAQVAQFYLSMKAEFKDYSDKLDFIQANLSKFPRESFVRWSDENLVLQVSPAWFKASGIPLDVQAENLSAMYFQEISIQEIVDFVLSYKIHKYVNPYRKAILELKEKLESLCNTKVTDSYAEHLASILNEASAPTEEVVQNKEDLPF